MEFSCVYFSGKNVHINIAMSACPSVSLHIASRQPLKGCLCNLLLASITNCSRTLVLTKIRPLRYILCMETCVLFCMHL
jgi:hypothetical protein